MSAVDNQLIVAGGMDANTSEPVDQVHVLDNHNDTWLHPFPGSSVPTVLASAIGYKKWLLVFGGWLTADLDCPLDVVQVLDTSSKKWYAASLLSTPATRPSLAIIQDTLYIAWSNITEKAQKIFIPTLLSDAKSYSLSVKPTCDWQTLPTTLTSFPLFGLKLHHPPLSCTFHTSNSGRKWKSSLLHTQVVHVVSYQPPKN